MKNLQSFGDFISGKKLSEMALTDVNVVRLLTIFDESDSKEKMRISEVISGHPHQDRKKLEKDFQEISYEELVDMMKELNLQPSK